MKTLKIDIMITLIEKQTEKKFFSESQKLPELKKSIIFIKKRRKFHKSFSKLKKFKHISSVRIVYETVSLKWVFSSI